MSFGRRAGDLSGPSLTYGEISASHRERFEPGAFAIADAVPLNVHHEALAAIAWQPGGGLELQDSEDALRMEATVAPIPAGEYALAEIAAGRISGLSIEFKALAERREDGVRVVERATLGGLALVRSPSYKGSRVEARSRRRRIWL